MPPDCVAQLMIEVLVRDDGGSVLAATIATAAAGSAWQPTLPMPILVNATNLPLVSDGTLQVAFRFTPIGLGGSWRIDDTYVDPYQADKEGLAKQ